CCVPSECFFQSLTISQSSSIVPGMNGTFFCNKCGAQNAAGAQFCNRCGAPTNPMPGVVQTPVASPSSTSPYSASATSYQAVAPAVGVGYGGFWIRVVAAIIDGII